MAVNVNWIKLWSFYFVLKAIQTKRDLLIMMDESGSVGAQRFENVKRIAAAIVKRM